MESTPSVLLHLLAVAHGVGASLLAFLLCFLAGLGLCPRRTHEPLTGGAHPAVLGGAVYVLMCWYGVRHSIPLGHLAAGFAVLALAAGVVRRHSLVQVLREGMAGRRWVGGVALFAALYALAYAFTAPPVTADHLPVAWTGNMDLFLYLDVTSYLQRLGPPQPTSLYLSAKDYVYFQTPGVFHLLGGFSMLFGGEPLSAAMPAQFALVALCGLVIGAITRRVFHLPAIGAGAVAGLTISGPFFRYLASNYYLSTLICLPILLHFLLTFSTRESPRDSVVDWRIVLSSLGHSLLLFFVYPILFLVALAFQAGAIGLRAAARWQEARAGGEGRPLAAIAREASGMFLALLAGLAAPFALAPAHVLWTIGMVRDLSAPGVWGWRLDLVSPLALLGAPASFSRLDVRDPVVRGWAIALLCAIGVALAAVAVWWGRRRGSPAQRTFAALSGLGFLGYVAYFLKMGPTYQQWKMASYLALPLSFVPLAAAIGFACTRLRRLNGNAGRVAGGALVILVAAAGIGGNLVVHAQKGRPSLRRLTGAFRNLGAVDAQSSFRDLSIATPERLTGLVAAYFLPSKRVHILGPRYYPPVSFDGVSAVRPLFVPHYSCEGVGHGDAQTVEGIGCLLLAPPSLAGGTVYPFSRSFLFIDPGGLGRREGWGRWNASASPRLSLLADRGRIRLDRDAAYLNLLLRPARAADGVALRLGWGAGRAAEVRLESQAWLSLPIDEPDWEGGRLARQVVKVGIAGMGQGQPSGPAVGFVAFALSSQPIGRVVGVVADSSRGKTRRGDVPQPRLPTPTTTGARERRDGGRTIGPPATSG